MPVLQKQRYELFCIGIAKGLTPTDSYVEAGYKPKGAHASAWKLQQKQEIATRIAELQELTAQRAAGIPDITQIEMAIHERIDERSGQVQVKYERWKELTSRKAELEQIKAERAKIMTDPNHNIISKMGGAAKFAGISTGLVVLNMKMLGKTAVPELELDTALLGELRAINREKSALESEIAQLMGFLKPINLSMNVDARQDNRSITQNVQIVKMVSSPSDEKGQW